MRRAIVAAILLAVITLGGLQPTLGIGAFWGAGAVAQAASPTPSEVVGGDPRSPQEGPGLVGNPGGAVLGVLAIAALAVVGTTIYVRLTGGPGRPR